MTKARRSPLTAQNSPLSTWSDLDAALARLCRLEAQQQRAELLLNEVIAHARKTWEPQLNKAAEQAAAIRAQVEQFALDHRADFSPAKTIERLHGVLSFRTSPPAVKPLNRKWTLKRILEAVRAVRPCFVRVRCDLAKDVILADRAAGQVNDAELAEVGLKVAQEEIFNLELRQDAAPDAQGVENAK